MEAKDESTGTLRIPGHFLDGARVKMITRLLTGSKVELTENRKIYRKGHRTNVGFGEYIADKDPNGRNRKETLG